MNAFAKCTLWAAIWHTCKAKFMCLPKLCLDSGTDYLWLFYRNAGIFVSFSLFSFFHLHLNVLRLVFGNAYNFFFVSLLLISELAAVY